MAGRRGRHGHAQPDDRRGRDGQGRRRAAVAVRRDRQDPPRRGRRRRRGRLRADLLRCRGRRMPRHPLRQPSPTAAAEPEATARRRPSRTSSATARRPGRRPAAAALAFAVGSRPAASDTAVLEAAPHDAIHADRCRRHARRAAALDAAGAPAGQAAGRRPRAGRGDRRDGAHHPGRCRGVRAARGRVSRSATDRPRRRPSQSASTMPQRARRRGSAPRARPSAACASSPPRRWCAAPSPRRT